jgi:uncharacterized FlgJ-related protein
MAKSNDQIIYDIAISQGFTPISAKLVVAQARFESADYTSNVFKNNLNTSGMKYIGQPLATRGTPAPKNEQRCNGGCDSDYYAKFKSVADSANDKIARLYNITMRGVSPEQLKNSKTPEEFANLLKKRGYYGGPENQYANGLKAKLLRVEIIEFVSKNKKSILLGVGLVTIALAYYLYKKNK